VNGEKKTGPWRIFRFRFLTMPKQSFPDRLWASISEDLYPAILAHPFLTGLTNGKLPEEAFFHYVRQDSAYLESFGRGLALLAARADRSEDFMMFCEHARMTLVVEKALHSEFLAGKPDLPPPPEWNQMAPTALLYASYLIRVAHERPFHEGVAAFLPCYWIYRRVGQHLVREGSPHPLYQKWIDTYSGEEFGEVVRQILELVERLADGLAEPDKERMIRHFRRTSQLEYLFWDMGYRREDWPFRKGRS
jgi:thiaminase/transcriptional activator TenA